MAQNPLGPPPFISQENAFDRWMRQLWQRVVVTGQILWGQIDLTGAEFVGDSGSGGVKGIVPAPAAGDSAKYLKGDGTWATGGGGDGTTNNVISTTTTIDADKSYMVVGYLTIESDFTNNGNVGIF
jgi:hypothetical protein